jgi:hypothetical protein
LPCPVEMRSVTANLRWVIVLWWYDSRVSGGRGWIRSR